MLIDVIVRCYRRLWLNRHRLDIHLVPSQYSYRCVNILVLVVRGCSNYTVMSLSTLCSAGRDQNVRFFEALQDGKVPFLLLILGDLRTDGRRTDGRTLIHAARTFVFRYHWFPDCMQ